ncbi:hypothetical protein [Flavobacterium ajazii]|uniref:hypothetical protein n=1 Tax=Flavobacterium ajazii TaxID=2692318 RepID=UPI0013D38CF1|nr:hypothetical protein [Flavobacterium ajazii]
MKKEMFKRQFFVSVLFVGLSFFAGCTADSEETNAEAEAAAQNETYQVSTAKGGNLSGEVTGSTGAYVTKVNGVTKYTGSDYVAAIQAAINNLTSGRDVKEWVTVRVSGASGSTGGALKYVNMASYTGLDFVNNTFNANSGDALVIPIWADRKTNVEVKNLKVTGKPRYGIWFKGCTVMNISNITMNIGVPQADLGLGIRVDNSTAATSNLTISGTINITGGDNSIETYGVDGFSIGNVTSSNNAACGVLLNQSKNGTVGTVTGTNNSTTGSVTGYATFRCANNNGPNIVCTKVYSRGSGRGFFSVTGSNGCTVNTVDIANTAIQGILLQDASNTKVLAGTVSNGHPNVQHVNSTSCSTKVNGQTYTATNGSW